MGKITYHNMGLSPVKRNAYVIEERLNGCTENRYHGYYNDKRGTFSLYPRERSQYRFAKKR